MLETPKINTQALPGKSLVPGSAYGQLIVSDTPLSFWGGVNSATGVVIDHHHPLHGETLSAKVLAIPGGRGSSSGSGALLELLLNACAPAALVFSHPEEILTLGVIVAEHIFKLSIPVLLISPESFSQLVGGKMVSLSDGELRYVDGTQEQAVLSNCGNDDTSLGDLELSEQDNAVLNGEKGKAAQVAMQIVCQVATLQGAKTLIDITQGHIDACVYNGPSSLKFAEELVSWGATVAVPTTLNSVSVDKQRWQQQGIDANFAKPASALGDAFVAMGAKPTFTCAPYLLDSAPAKGEQIVWAESNAVMFANSVLGARTQKYPDFLDVAISLTGRAPLSGAHLNQGRIPTIVINVANINAPDDAFWPLLGYLTGEIANAHLPLIKGLEHLSPTQDELKAFSAAFATTSSTAMFHMSGITPEADLVVQEIETNAKPLRQFNVTHADLAKSWVELNSATLNEVDLICLGNPHFSLTECASLANLCDQREKHKHTQMIVTLGRSIYEQAQVQGYIRTLEIFGVQFITDTCWCMITHPIIPTAKKALLTNSGKYAHYGPGISGRGLYFAKLSDCVDAACTGTHTSVLPEWLDKQRQGSICKLSEDPAKSFNDHANTGET